MPSRSPFFHIIPSLRAGGVGILPTDTIYGIVGSALQKKTVERIYRLRKRNPRKPMIVLVADIRDLAQFGVSPNARAKNILRKIWPDKVSVIMPIASSPALKKFRYLHRGTKTLAFRMPKPAWLRALLKATGPLVAPSANFEGKTPAKDIKAAKRFFGDRVDFYIDTGKLVARPSTLIAIKEGKVEVLRRGAVKV